MTLLLKNNENKYILKHKIGNGATCECYVGEKINEKKSEIYAIKIFEQKFFEFYSNEVSFLSKLNENKNIIKLYEYGQGILTPSLTEDNNNNNDDNNNNNNNNDNSNEKKVYYEIMEYANNGELKDYVNDTSSRIPENISAKLFMRITKAVKYLHENDIAHCDLKPENILLDKNFNPKINDFGFSQKFDGKNGNFLLCKRSRSPIYSSPDVRLASTKGYNGIKNDIFSLGVLLFVITIGDFPFESATYSDEKYKFIIKGRFTKYWEFFNYINISDEFKDLINNLISLNPSKRLTIEEILKHPWLVKQLGESYNKLNNDISIKDDKNYEYVDKEVYDELSTRKV